MPVLMPARRLDLKPNPINRVTHKSMLCDTTSHAGVPFSRESSLVSV